MVNLINRQGAKDAKVREKEFKNLVLLASWRLIVLANDALPTA
jgi:hypothetical protein